MSFAPALERRVGNAMHELSLIRRELLMQKMEKQKRSTKLKHSWEALSQQISVKWDNVSVQSELDSQREKTW